MFDDRVAVAKFGRRFRVSGNARKLLDELRTHRRRNECRTAAKNFHAANIEQLARIHLKSTESRCCKTVIQPTAQGTAHRLGLFRNLLAHEVGEVAFVMSIVSIGNHRRGLRGDASLKRRGLVAICAHHCEFAVIEMYDTLRVTHQRECVGRNEHFLLANANHHRAAMARHNNAVRLLRIDHSNAISPNNLPQRAAHFFCQRFAWRCRDQVREHFRIRAGTERDTLCFQARAQSPRIFKNAVVHNGVAVCRISVRMRIHITGLAVGGPTGVGNT